MSDAVKAVGSIFKAPKMPSISTPKMPDPGTFQTKLAARRTAREDKKKRGGRESTVKTGGGNYSGANLGGTA
jgi:hypothetical protein